MKVLPHGKACLIFFALALCPFWLLGCIVMGISQGGIVYIPCCMSEKYWHLQFSFKFPIIPLSNVCGITLCSFFWFTDIITSISWTRKVDIHSLACSKYIVRAGHWVVFCKFSIVICYVLNPSFLKEWGYETKMEVNNVSYA